MRRSLFTTCCFLLLAVAVSPAAGHETDQHTPPAGREFADLGPDLTLWMYDILDRAVAALNAQVAQAVQRGDEEGQQRLQSPDAAANAVNAQMPMGYGVIEDLEYRINSPAMKQRFPGRIVSHKAIFAHLYQRAHLPFDPRHVFRIWFASSFRAYGVYMGADKVGHFTDMGMRYFREYRSALAAGASPAEAERRAVWLGTDHPLLSEAGLLGYVSAGAYSNADNASNYLGFLFYRNLTEPVMLQGQLRPPLLTRDGPGWRLADHVRADSDFFAWFFSGHFDEALNPSHFLPSMQKAIRRAIGARQSNVLWRYRDANGTIRPPRYFQDLAEQFTTYWGIDYGHGGKHNELITIASACYDLPGITPLHLAAWYGDATALQDALASHPTALNDGMPAKNLCAAGAGDRPLHLAAASGDAQCVRLLLDAGALAYQANDAGVTPLHRAASEAAAQLLLDAGAPIHHADFRGRTPLHWAATDKDRRTVALLLRRGADVNAVDLHGRTPLHDAAQAGYVEAVQALLEGGAEVNRSALSGGTALHMATTAGEQQVVALLLGHGASGNARDELGATPLHLAARHGLDRIIELLLNGGAHPAAVNLAGSTALHLACRHGREAAALSLIRATSDVNVANHVGMTPLHEAAFAGDPAIIQKLVERGADPDQRNTRGQTPGDVARRRGHPAPLAADFTPDRREASARK